MSIVFELLHQALPEVPLDRGVASANTGNLACDLLPLITMLPCAQTIQLFWRRGRRLDVFLFSLGFVLALIYHWLHMHPDGIAAATLLGLPGSTWRGLDILMAQALLARTLGHALGARSPATLLVANLAYPATLLAYAHLLADGVLTLGFASKVLVVVLLATLACKAAVEGWGTLPKYCPRRGRRTLACYALGFAVFPLPELLPRHYWLFHSLWHMLMADGYQHLYLQLEGQYSEEGAALTGGAGWLQSLLQPWHSFVRYQEEQMEGELLSSGKEQ